MELLRAFEEIEFTETEFAKAEAPHALKHEVHDLDKHQQQHGKKTRRRTARFGHGKSTGLNSEAATVSPRIMPANRGAKRTAENNKNNRDEHHGVDLRLKEQAVKLTKEKT